MVDVIRIETFSDEGFPPAATWASLLLEEGWDNPAAAKSRGELADFLSEDGYARPLGRYNRRMRRVMEEIHTIPASFYAGDLAASITEELKVFTHFFKFHSKG